MPYRAIEHLTTRQVGELLALYQREWWSAGRTREEITEMLRHTDMILGLVEEDTDRLVGFLRVLTDFVYKALVFDVIVAEAHRGRGLGRELMQRLGAHPRLARVRTVELYCRPELAAFYRRWGFSEDLGDLLFMRRTHGVD
ncbi:MAG: GNAT family N-acetyltransferase [Planctomycetes bacterium]|nr:GNAT family N-acetyltransferase [Planctomycetota bacterium]